MKPLFVLLLVFIIAVVVLKLTTGNYQLPLSARIAMCVMLCFTAIAHFVFSKGMTMMVPGFIPYKKELVYFTGVLEIVLGIGLLIPSFRVVAAWLLIGFFILMLPANIHAAIHKIDYQKGSLNGPGLTYLWFRVPLQLLFISWTYFSTIMK
ncbi:DoxX family protein [Terrimonas alba]|uniref:DoxX family protein n=1 Tax=Terrimonas alba TaxID=3349636 RepID=UPI0035F3D5A8